MAIYLGGNSATSGFTDRSRAAAEVFGPSVMLWLSSAGPQDAARYPGAFHFVRLPNWGLGATTDSYMMAIDPIVTRWRSAVPGAIFVLGNEPEYEAGHNADDFPAMAAAARQRFPGVKLANPPFKAENTNRLTRAIVDAADHICVHSYWETFAPDDRGNEALGASYRLALRMAGAKPVLVAEVNAVATGEGAEIDWGRRNAQVAGWIDQAERDGLWGACLFLLDGAGEWASYDVGPEAARQIVQMRGAQPLPPPPPPVVPPTPPIPAPTPVAGYTRSYDPRGYRPLDGRWLPFVRQHNPEEADAICAAVEECATRIGYDANAMIAQGCVETGVFTSQRWRNAHAAAGIGIGSDDTLDIIWGQGAHGDVQTGIRAQADLLTDYFGGGSEPFGTLAPHGFGGMVLHKAHLSDMDGVWAADTGYSAAIVGYLNTVLGGAPAQPASSFSVVRPVDCPVFQGSDGSFSHGGASAGFFAIDYGCQRGTPCRAAASGVVGIIYHGDSNPISLRTGPSIWIDHDNGYSTFSCHMSRIDVQTGERVAQGQVIGLTGDPAIDGGFGDGAHLHWEIWDTARHVRVKMEDLEASGIAGPWGDVPTPEVADMLVESGFDDGILKRQWDGAKSAAQIKKCGGFSRQRAIDLKWEEELKAGRPLGFAISNEESDKASGRVVRFFSNGRITYFVADGSMKVN